MGLKGEHALFVFFLEGRKHPHMCVFMYMLWKSRWVTRRGKNP